LSAQHDQVVWRCVELSGLIYVSLSLLAEILLHSSVNH